MHLNRLHLTEFRSYRHLEIDIPSVGLVLVGRNASGKSTLLEAVRMLSTLRSPRSTHDRDVINWMSGEELVVAPYARVVGQATGESGDISLELGLQRGEEANIPLRKVIRINQQNRRMQDSIGSILTVLFTPEDLDLISGSPGGRRRFIDLMLSQVDRPYVQHLARFIRVTEQRNSLLRAHHRQGVSRSALVEQIGFWDEKLIGHGAYVVAVRREILGTLCDAFSRRVSDFTTSAVVAAAYAPNLGIDFLDATRPTDDRTQLIAVARRSLEAAIAMRRDEEFRRGVTLVGPHRDDLEILLDSRPMSDFGSRGQQRLAVVALKLAEADVIRTFGEQPILLLDDVLSELDITHRSALLETIAMCGAQILITTADAAQIADTPMRGLRMATVESGTVSLG
ncbi:MAG TPA: DNA replication/repair protein RecF [Thermomicrobiales bacterium]|nr:DNA replication/repair protein RecF [Thermomicrobiales bacterium]